MGKYIDKKRKNDKVEKGKYFFDVLVKVHGKNIHQETYSIDRNDIRAAQELGYLKEELEYENYFDWKPLNNVSTVKGGIYEVIKYEFDDKYAYAYTKERVYSLPKYLYDKLPRKDYILFGKREK